MILDNIVYPEGTIASLINADFHYSSVSSCDNNCDNGGCDYEGDIDSGCDQCDCDSDSD
jgi:hypothetical protein